MKNLVIIGGSDAGISAALRVRKCLKSHFLRCSDDWHI